MPDIKITSPDGLIETTIKAKQETYYLVTEDNLASLKQKSILADILMLLASLTWGAYFSVVITIKALPPETDPNNPTKNILQALHTLGGVFLIAGIIFAFFAVLMIYFSFDQVQQMKKSKLEIKDKNEQQVHPGQQKQQYILILSATYEWPGGQENVTAQVKDLVYKGIYTIVVDPGIFGIKDPAWGIVKTLNIHCKINGQEKVFVKKDGERFTLE